MKMRTVTLLGVDVTGLDSWVAVAGGNAARVECVYAETVYTYMWWYGTPLRWSHKGGASSLGEAVRVVNGFHKLKAERQPRIRLRLTLAEQAKVADEAYKAGLSPAEWCRNLVLSEVNYRRGWRK